MNDEARDLNVEVAPWGPDQATVSTVSCALFEHSVVQEYLMDARVRLLAFELVDPEQKILTPKPPGRYLATIYDYSNNRTIFVEGCLHERELILISESSIQPLPSDDEFDAAVNILLNDPQIGRAIRQQHLLPYRPMPPLIEQELPDGRLERTLAIGLLPGDDRARHEIVGVNMVRESVVRFESRAPENSAAHNPICGLPNAFQATATKGTAGQVWLTVTQGNTVLWKFLAVRPAASSGTNGSGVELRYVDYRGKRVLYRAHVPILNVKYDPGGCGPYRDWQYQEGMIQATGTDVAPGFRLCPTPAKTILDTGSDVGNFLGVGIYVQGQEVVLVSEMEAGWYRYVSEWRLSTNGTIRPRFGFAAVESSCVCNVHHHHVYWRLDFDIQTAGGNRVIEFNDPPIIGSSRWHTKNYEIKRSRDPAHRRKWQVKHGATGEGYEVIPGPNDGVATASPDWPFPRGDVWILRYRGSEIDDGVIAIGPPYEANLDSFQNGESINNKDVVIWYAGHFTHDVAEEPPGHFGHIVGPSLKPVNW